MATTDFAGRLPELRRLYHWLDEVRRSGNGRLVALRGRRQVGKSTLIDRFCTSTGAPTAFFAAAKRQPASAALQTFSQVVAASALPNASTAGTGFTGWEQALDVATQSSDGAVVIVIDELPWLLEMDETLEGSLQRVWDRVLKHRAVLMILIGSDLAMMEALSEYGRPLYDRATPMRIDPLTPADVADLTGVDAAGAIEAWSLTGGFPNVVKAWQPGSTAEDFLRSQLLDPSSPFIVSGERKVAAEFPADAIARVVLDAIGSGIREYSKISQRCGLHGASLERALAVLTDKRAVARERPYSTDVSKLSWYRVDDAHLRAWGRYVAPNFAAIERGAGATVVERTLGDWEAWRGQAIEPIVRESVLRLTFTNPDYAGVAHVGRWWRRDGRVEVDLVIGDRLPTAHRVAALGSIKWRQQAPFAARDLAALVQAAQIVPGATGADLVAVSRTGGSADGLTHLWSPTDLVAAWR